VKIYVPESGEYVMVGGEGKKDPERRRSRYLKNPGKKIRGSLRAMRRVRSNEMKRVRSQDESPEGSIREGPKRSIDEPETFFKGRCGRLYR
jgi:hypothetical protein